MIEVTHFTHPGCPWAYSAWPGHTTLRWRYGVQLRWTLVVIGLTVFRIHWGSAPLALALLIGCFVFCVASLGMLSGSLFASADAASGFGVVASLVMSAMAGCWWPAEVMPAWMQQASYALPSAWALNGLHELISWGGDFGSVALHCTVLLLFGAAFLTLAVRRLDVSA